MMRETFERALKAQAKILDCYDEQRQIIDEQVEENRGLRRDVLLMQKVNAEQRALIEQQAKEIANLKAEGLVSESMIGGLIKQAAQTQQERDFYKREGRLLLKRVNL